MQVASMNKKPGDWNCPTCQHLNFSRRDTCQRCGDPRPGGAGEFGRFSSRGSGSSTYAYGSGYGGGGSGASRSYGSSFGFGGGSDICVRPGDWYCSIGSCNAHNFASRSSCFKCGAFKDDRTDISLAFESFGIGGRISRGGFGFGSSYIPGGTARSGWKSGDWICGRSECNEHNFASRKECFRCTAPRGFGITSDN
ncbi:hypothetical protein O6H91_23G052000 [Diphasiastrum complanatum]|uniref:Uncharacterized protein n=2 Tax=Diphasiastrum complanatum TaxID=34168 RepID=A0ACC2AAU2_DIPCM|nr:hypothetical protein O6H91_23G051000 [Diphasiastrum complanatum]KAJ7514606.1 hypothetical protein O6H91_23G052000 [Diphasiastrum complanatum]